MLITAIIAFLIIFSLLILVHEAGHFMMARKFGVKVEEFGMGLPPKAKTLFKDKHETEYTLNWLPLGGFVRMKGEDAHSPKLLKEKDSFAARPVWQRIIISIAGVTMNYITGFILFVIIFAVGNTYSVANDQLEEAIAKRPQAEIVSQQPLGMLVEDILPSSPAADSELRKYDFISAVDGENVNSFDELTAALQAKSEKESTLSITRRNYEFDLAVTPDAEGKIGIATDAFTSITIRYPFLTATKEAFFETGRLTVLIAKGVGGLFAGLFQGEISDDIGGPVAIAQEIFYRSTSVMSLLTFAALLSIILALFNILPIPALDGGRLIFLLYEAITRRRPNPRIEAKIHMTGYILLLGLIALITIQDIFR